MLSGCYCGGSRGGGADAGANDTGRLSESSLELECCMSCLCVGGNDSRKSARLRQQPFELVPISSCVKLNGQQH